MMIWMDLAVDCQQPKPTRQKESEGYLLFGEKKGRSRMHGQTSRLKVETKDRRMEWFSPIIFLNIIHQEEKRRLLSKTGFNLIFLNKPFFYLHERGIV